MVKKRLFLLFNFFTFLGNNKINYNKEVKYLMQTNKYAPSTDEKYNKLKIIRENLEKYGGFFIIILSFKFLNFNNEKAEKGLNVSKVKL